MRTRVSNFLLYMPGPLPFVLPLYKLVPFSFTLVVVVGVFLLEFTRCAIELPRFDDQDGAFEWICDESSYRLAGQFGQLLFPNQGARTVYT